METAELASLATSAPTFRPQLSVMQELAGQSGVYDVVTVLLPNAKIPDEFVDGDRTDPRAYVRYFTSQLLPFLSLCRELKKTDAEVAHEIAKWLSGNHAGSFTHILKEQERHAMTKTHLQDVLDRLLLRQNDIVELRADHDAKFAKQEEKNAKQEAEILTLNEEISALKDNMKYVLSVVLNHATSANAATEVITNVSKAHLEDTA